MHSRIMVHNKGVVHQELMPQDFITPVAAWWHTYLAILVLSAKQCNRQFHPDNSVWPCNATVHSRYLSFFHQQLMTDIHSSPVRARYGCLSWVWSLAEVWLWIYWIVCNIMLYYTAIYQESMIYGVMALDHHWFRSWGDTYIGTKP